jgi:hypothetical protein
MIFHFLLEKKWFFYLISYCFVYLAAIQTPNHKVAVFSLIPTAKQNNTKPKLSISPKFQTPFTSIDSFQVS